MSSETASDTPRLTGRPAPVGDAVSMFTVGSLVAGYRIEQVLATGATGTVYLAKNPTLPRRDALKVLSADLSRDPAFRERFVREADIASLLAHPNIVSIYNRGEAEEGHLWIAMQYVAGTDAEAALQAGEMPPARAIRIVSEVAKALDYAHQLNVVHHDVKPGNVLLANGTHDDEHVLLSDFGVARVAGNTSEPGGFDEEATIAVTLAYAAPEVIAGAPIDGRADIYSLGCTLFRMLTGKQPFFTAEGTTAVARAHLHQAPPRISDHLPSATRQLDVVMARALAKNPEDRFSSAREFAAAAAAAHSSAGGTATARGHGRSPSRPSAGSPALNGHARTAALERFLRTNAVLARVADLPWPVVIGGTVIAFAALITAIAMRLSPTSSPPTQPPTAPTTSTPSAALETAALVRLLPPSYPRGTCAPAPLPDGAAAAMSCGPNTDPGGRPTSSAYTVARDADVLRDYLADTISQSSALICPPNNQSPGPWRRNDSPTVTRGTLFCGIEGGQPVVAWTDDEQLLLGVAQTRIPSATVEALYTWWTAHS